VASGKRIGCVTPLVATGATHEYEMQLAEYVRQLSPHPLDLALPFSLFLPLCLSLAMVPLLTLALSRLDINAWGPLFAGGLQCSGGLYEYSIPRDVSQPNRPRL